MSSFPNETFFDITNFLPNDDITDLMLMSKTFNVFVTPRLKKIDHEMATMNQSITSFMPMPTPNITIREYFSRLNLKRFEPIGSKAKKRMKELFENEDDLLNRLWNSYRNGTLSSLKEVMSLERFDDLSFVFIFRAFVKEYSNSIKSTIFQTHSQST
ncbi:hypothetical protein DdX_16403 [Ditylenchus destructor]|uniref:F-box domain-containing protein n=1 Tax=Ditylenchus destructor TaxID=166010 RepID=A0AAD4MTM4_9BILA|nr:hypothetical protein DdX_16403 [Ditylenchus destructor]